MNSIKCSISSGHNNDTWFVIEDNWIIGIFYSLAKADAYMKKIKHRDEYGFIVGSRANLVVAILSKYKSISNKAVVTMMKKEHKEKITVETVEWYRERDWRRPER